MIEIGKAERIGNEIDHKTEGMTVKFEDAVYLESLTAILQGLPQDTHRSAGMEGQMAIDVQSLYIMTTIFCSIYENM